MLAPENVFSSGKFHCPGCHSTLEKATNTCPHCGFNAHLCIARFPFEPPPLKRVMDPDGVIDAHQKKRLSRTIARLEKAFPQITVSFCAAFLPEGVDGRQFGYWLLNRCPPVSGSDAKRRLHHLLLLVDRNSKTVSATVGYGLDCFLDDMTLCKALQASSDHFIHEGYIEGSINWINIIRKKLAVLHEKSVTDWKRRFNTRHRHSVKDDLADDEEKQANTLPQNAAVLPQSQSSPRQKNSPQYAVKSR
jgi:hypothetical protein